jgi:hypothetical protein
MPETEAELIARNAYLLRFGITPIWFPTGCYEYVEQILRLARNEMKYRGHVPGLKNTINEPIPTQTETAEVKLTGLKKLLNNISNFFGF